MWKKLQRNLPSILALSKTMYQQEKQRKLAIAIQVVFCRVALVMKNAPCVCWELK